MLDEFISMFACNTKTLGCFKIIKTSRQRQDQRERAALGGGKLQGAGLRRHPPHRHRPKLKLGPRIDTTPPYNKHQGCFLSDSLLHVGFIPGLSCHLSINMEVHPFGPETVVPHRSHSIHSVAPEDIQTVFGAESIGVCDESARFNQR